MWKLSGHQHTLHEALLAISTCYINGSRRGVRGGNGVCVFVCSFPHYL